MPPGLGVVTFDQDDPFHRSASFNATAPPFVPAEPTAQQLVADVQKTAWSSLVPPELGVLTFDHDFPFHRSARFDDPTAQQLLAEVHAAAA